MTTGEKFYELVMTSDEATIIGFLHAIGLAVIDGDLLKAQVLLAAGESFASRHQKAFGSSTLKMASLANKVVQDDTEEVLFK